LGFCIFDPRGTALTQETAVEISDEVVIVALNAADVVILKAIKDGTECDDGAQEHAMRAALQAAIPLVMDGLVNSSYERCDPEKMGCVRDYSEGQNDLADAILAKVKK
jgi:hypothetical protein